MFYQHLKIAFRNIIRHKFFSVITILGLALGISFCIPAIMIVNNQFQFDDFHPKPGQTFRIISQLDYVNGTSMRLATTPLPLADNLEKNYEFVEKAVPVYKSISEKAISAGKKLRVSGVFTTSDFFEVFGFELQSGDGSSALEKPHSVILTDKTAYRFFEDQDPVGENFHIPEVGDLTITGVLKPQMDQTHLQFDVLVSLNTIEASPLMVEEQLADWNTRGTYTYVLTKVGVAKPFIQQHLDTLTAHIQPQIFFEEYEKGMTFDVQTLGKISPGEGLYYDIGAGKTRPLSHLLTTSAVALIILLMACFNYTNLSIARALKRSVEVGIYQVTGATRWQMIRPFIIQSTLTAGGAFIFAYALLPFLPLPVNLIEEVRSITPDAVLVGYMAIFVVLVGIIAGLLPALLLTSVSPVNALKKVKNISLLKGLKLRKSLVVIQFSVSVALLVSTAIIYQQMQFMATSDYGFATENIIDIDLQGVDANLVKQEVSRIPGVQQVSGISNRFGLFTYGADVQKNRDKEAITTDYFYADKNLIDNMELTLIAGTNFPTNKTGTSTQYIIVNEQFVEVFDWENPAEAIGESVWIQDSLQAEIAGVLRDFNFESLTVPIRPMMLRYNPEHLNFLNVKLASSKSENVILKLQNTWKSMVPELPFKYTSVSEHLYRSHANTRDMLSMGFYSLIALVIAALGLLGIVTYTVEIRTKEIGIRKVLGAKVSGLITLLSKEFAFLLLLAAFIGIPGGYLVGDQFLSTYHYQVEISPGTFLLGIGILFVVALITIGSQTWRLAYTNPARSLRSE
ncbi:MAG: FtsX-like permease family protein [Balneolaceae bacterium]|nr:FtsX-like permease family protein [Balneolaceae bacterium]